MQPGQAHGASLETLKKAHSNLQSLRAQQPAHPTCLRNTVIECGCSLRQPRHIGYLKHGSLGFKVVVSCQGEKQALEQPEPRTCEGTQQFTRHVPCPSRNHASLVDRVEKAGLNLQG